MIHVHPEWRCYRTANGEYLAVKFDGTVAIHPKGQVLGEHDTDGRMWAAGEPYVENVR